MGLEQQLNTNKFVRARHRQRNVSFTGSHDNIQTQGSHSVARETAAHSPQKSADADENDTLLLSGNKHIRQRAKTIATVRHDHDKPYHRSASSPMDNSPLCGKASKSMETLPTTTHVLEVLTQTTPFGAMALQVTHVEPTIGPDWSEQSTFLKLRSLLKVTVRLLLIVACLYLFICSLSLLSNALRILAGRHTTSLFNSDLLRNPVVCLMIGLLVTVALHSSSTSTSVTIAMVAAGVLPVEFAVYIVMGANIGTTVTSTCVSLVQSGDREEFRRAFAGATLGSMFNWLSVLIFLPLEVTTGFLKVVSGHIVDALHLQTDKGADRAYLKALTNPVTKQILQLNKTMLEELAESTDPNLYINDTMLRQNASYIFANTKLSDNQIGIILGITSLLFLCTALVGLVKTLHSMLGGRLALVVKRVVNAQLPGPLRHFTGYLFIAFAVVCTILIQSSSIFTSTLTPLVGVGIVSLERMYTFTLGSDLGTTLTGLLAALASNPESIKVAMQVAFCHLIFNVAGILLFYPIPFMRWPVMLSQWMGDTTARYRWFPIFYIIVVFVVLPGAAIVLSLAGTTVMLFVGGPPVILFVVIVLINVVQNVWPQFLPHSLRSWHFLPEWMRSLEPYDRAMQKMSCYKKLAKCTTNSASSRDDEFSSDNNNNNNGISLEMSPTTSSVASYSNGSSSASTPMTSSGTHFTVITPLNRSSNISIKHGKRLKNNTEIFVKTKTTTTIV